MTRSPRGTVLVVGPIPPPVHGAARVTDRMRAALATAGARVVTVDTSAQHPDGRELGPVARVGRLLGGLARTAWWAGRGASVYVGGAGGVLLWYQALVLLLARVARVTAVFHHHSFAYVTRRDRAMAAVVGLGGPGVHHVVLGEAMAAGLRATYPAVRDVRVCSNAGLLPPAEAAAGPGADGPVLGHLSNLSLAKGLGDVVTAFDRVHSRDPRARLVLAGPAADAEAEAVLAAAQDRFGPAVQVLGRVPADAVGDVYRAIDLFCFPSRYVHEAEPLVVLDAMRHGVETVAYDVGCLGELVRAEHLVATDGDYVAAVEQAALGDRADRGTLTAAFDARRAAAASSHAVVVALLTGR